MILDKQNLLALDQVVTAAASTTDYLDLGAARDIGIARPGSLFIRVGETVTSGGASTVQFQVQCDDNTSFSSAKTVVQTDAIPKATLVNGYGFYIPVPIGLDERYVRVYFNVAVANLTAGKFTVAFVQGEQANRQYADALTAV